MKKRSEPATKSTPNVIVIGAGFAGLETVRSLAKSQVNITLIDQRNYHLFQPLLYQIATACSKACKIRRRIWVASSMDFNPGAKSAQLL